MNYHWSHTTGDQSDWTFIPQEVTDLQPLSSKTMYNPDSSNGSERQKISRGSLASSPVPGSDGSGSPKKSQGKATEGMTALPPQFTPGDKDVVCARGKSRLSAQQPRHLLQYNLTFIDIIAYNRQGSERPSRKRLVPLTDRATYPRVLRMRNQT